MQRTRCVNFALIAGTIQQSKNFRWRFWIALVVFVAASTSAATADKQYPTTIITAPGSPVSTTKCEAWARDWNKTVLIAHAAVGDVLFDLGISFTNKSSKPITEVRASFLSYDSTGALVDSAILGTHENPAADGASVDPGVSFALLGPRSWHGHNKHPERDHLTCEITFVRFADASAWSAPPQPSPQP